MMEVNLHDEGFNLVVLIWIVLLAVYLFYTKYRTFI